MPGAIVRHLTAGGSEMFSRTDPKQLKGQFTSVEAIEFRTLPSSSLEFQLTKCFNNLKTVEIEEFPPERVAAR